MSKKTFMAAISISLILILTAGGALVIELARANPVPWPSTPNEDKPTLTIETPENNTEYNDSGVYLSFTVTIPDSWNDPQWFMPYIGQIASVKAHLDGNSIYYGSGNSGSYFITLNQSASGLHMLNVTVLSYTYYQGPIYGNSSTLSSIVSSRGPVYEYPIVVSDIVYFIVLGDPSPSPQETGSFSTVPVAAGEIPLQTLVVVLAVLAIVIGVGLLVFFKKRRHTNKFNT